MDRVVAFLNTHQHKVLFLFHDQDKRVRYIMVVSRRKGHMFLIEIGHGGITLPAIDSTGEDKEDLAWSVMTADAYRYQICPCNAPPEIPTNHLKWMQARIPSWGWDGGCMASIVFFRNPVMMIAGADSIISFRLDDFEWSLDSDGLFVMIRLEDFHTLTHTIHERMDKLIQKKTAHICNIVSDFLQKSIRQWNMPSQTLFLDTLQKHIREVQSIQESMQKTRQQLCTLYKILHNVSIETLSIEDRMSSVDQMVFHQILSFGQQKRKLYRSMDQMRLLEKHTLEFLISLHFQHDDRYGFILSNILDIQTHLLHCHETIQGFLTKAFHNKNDAISFLDQ